VTEELSVEGIGHRVDTRGETMTFYTSPTLVARLFTLDDVIAGELDAIRNILG